jgi:hypothetical protein
MYKLKFLLFLDVMCLVLVGACLRLGIVYRSHLLGLLDS